MKYIYINIHYVTYIPDAAKKTSSNLKQSMKSSLTAVQTNPEWQNCLIT